LRRTRWFVSITKSSGAYGIMITSILYL
jgi:hypothetical protein